MTVPDPTIAPARSTGVALELADVTIADGDDVIVAGLHLRVGYGDTATLAARTEDGAIAIADACLGLRAPASGSIRVAGQAPADALAAGRIGVIPGDDSLPDGVRVGELVRLVLAVQATPVPFDRLTVRAGLDAVLDVPVDRLSPSARRAVQLALAIAGDPDVVVVLEPAAPAEAVAAAMAAEIDRLASEGRGVLRITVAALPAAPA